jgi:periplasmic protein TonB
MIHTKRNSTLSIISVTSLLFVLMAHAALLYGMWHHRLPSTNLQTIVLSAELIVPSQPKTEAPEAPKVDLKAEPIPPPPEKPKVVKKTPPQPKQRQLVSSAPVLPQEEFVAPPPPTPEPVHEPEPVQKQETQTVVAARPEQMQTGPVTLSSELSVSCPELNAPDYPVLSRRLGEEGKLMLQVELDESGHISNTRIINSSGYSRLDNAALAAVKTWRCRPAVRDGQPVRAIALQPFNFVIQGN